MAFPLYDFKDHWTHSCIWKFYSWTQSSTWVLAFLSSWTQSILRNHWTQSVLKIVEHSPYSGTVEHSPYLQFQVFATTHLIIGRDQKVSGHNQPPPGLIGLRTIVIFKACLQFYNNYLPQYWGLLFYYVLVCYSLQFWHFGLSLQK